MKICGHYFVLIVGSFGSDISLWLIHTQETITPDWQRRVFLPYRPFYFSKPFLWRQEDVILEINQLFDSLEMLNTSILSYPDKSTSNLLNY